MRRMDPSIAEDFYQGEDARDFGGWNSEGAKGVRTRIEVKQVSKFDGQKAEEKPVYAFRWYDEVTSYMSAVSAGRSLAFVLSTLDKTAYKFAVRFAKKNPEGTFTNNKEFLIAICDEVKKEFGSRFVTTKVETRKIKGWRKKRSQTVLQFMNAYEEAKNEYTDLTGLRISEDDSLEKLWEEVGIEIHKDSSNNSVKTAVMKI